MEGVFRFKSWFLHAPRLIHDGRGAYCRNFTVGWFVMRITQLIIHSKLPMMKCKILTKCLQGNYSDRCQMLSLGLRGNLAVPVYPRKTKL